VVGEVARAADPGIKRLWEQFGGMVYVIVSDPGQTGSLCAFFASVHGDARATADPRRVAVELPGAASRQRERIEVAAYLTTWKALHRGCDVQLEPCSMPGKAA
jgi:hypothetical protein